MLVCVEWNGSATSSCILVCAARVLSMWRRHSARSKTKQNKNSSWKNLFVKFLILVLCAHTVSIRSSCLSVVYFIFVLILFHRIFNAEFLVEKFQFCFDFEWKKNSKFDLTAKMRSICLIVILLYVIQLNSAEESKECKNVGQYVSGPAAWFRLLPYK